MPAKPDEEVDRIPMMGNTYRMHLLTSVVESNGAVYMAVVQEFPALTGVLTPAVRLDKFMEGFKEGLFASLASSPAAKSDLQLDRNFDFKGHPGRQYKLTIGESQGVVRVLDAGRRVYVLLVLGADEKNSSVVRFFDSFEFKAAPDPVAIPVAETKSA